MASFPRIIMVIMSSEICILISVFLKYKSGLDSCSGIWCTETKMLDQLNANRLTFKIRILLQQISSFRLKWYSRFSSPPLETLSCPSTVVERSLKVLKAKWFNQISFKFSSTFIIENVDVRKLSKCHFQAIEKHLNKASQSNLARPIPHEFVPSLKNFVKSNLHSISRSHTSNYAYMPPKNQLNLTK